MRVEAGIKEGKITTDKGGFTGRGGSEGKRSGGNSIIE